MSENSAASKRSPLVRYLIELAVLAVGAFVSARLAVTYVDNGTLQTIAIVAGVLLAGIAGRWIADQTVRSSAEPNDDRRVR